jgi:hypothetical protein
MSAQQSITTRTTDNAYAQHNSNVMKANAQLHYENNLPFVLAIYHNRYHFMQTHSMFTQKLPSITSNHRSVLNSEKHVSFS